MQAPHRAYLEACSNRVYLWLEEVQCEATRSRGVEGYRLLEEAHRPSKMVDRKGSKQVGEVQLVQG